MLDRLTLPWRTRGAALITLALVATLVLAGVGAAIGVDDSDDTSTAVASNAELTRGDTSPGAVTNHTLSYDLDNATETGTEFDVVVIDYSNPTTDLSAVTASGITMRDDTGHSWNGTDIESVSVSNSESRLRIVMTKNASFSLNDRERVWVSYEPVTNSIVSSDNLSVTMTLYDEATAVETGTVQYAVGEEETTTTTTTSTTTSETSTTTAGSTATDPPATTTAPAGTDQTTPGSQPGFGVGLAVLAIAATMVVAVRRRA
ncbi:PGF-CTERM sorting domain-containing protein [Haloarchaeobius sp. HRN-SO-5]|uniref:PGF-CTERM sorting domain-containing protein n=1 Tax=Haloarchaeobius sp. HRN-SO-5 TaxID=3446118 RepID=UPI003EBD0D4D